MQCRQRIIIQEYSLTTRQSAGGFVKILSMVFICNRWLRPTLFFLLTTIHHNGFGNKKAFDLTSPPARSDSSTEFVFLKRWPAVMKRFPLKRQCLGTCNNAPIRPAKQFQKSPTSKLLHRFQGRRSFKTKDRLRLHKVEPQARSKRQK